MAVNNITSPRAPGNHSSSFADTWSSTYFNTVKCSHTWTIHNFSFCKKETGHLIKSPTFSPEANDKMKWRLHLYPNGYDKEQQSYISLYLYLESCDNKSEVRTKYELSIRDALNVKINRSRGDYTFLPRDGSHGFGKFIHKDALRPMDKALKGPLHDDKLTIVCELEVFDDIVNISGGSKTIVPPKSPESHVLGADLGLFLETPQFSDITLTINDKDIHAHKVILAAHSPVFSAMFEHDMEEKKQNRVEIDDIDYEVFMEILRFMYTNKTSNLEKMADGMLAAADKYALITLKVMCEEALRKNLKIETAADILILAHLHNANQLKMQVMEFIFFHTEDVVETETFKSMMMPHPDLAIEIIRALSMRISGKSISTTKAEKR